MHIGHNAQTRLANYHQMMVAARDEIANAEKWADDDPANVKHYEQYSARYQKILNDTLRRSWILRQLIERS